MKLKRIKKIELEPEKVATKKKRLPKDEYKSLIEGEYELPISEMFKIVLSSSRNITGEVNEPMVDLRLHQTTEKYTGLTNKGFRIPAELIYEMIEELELLAHELDTKGII